MLISNYWQTTPTIIPAHWTIIFESLLFSSYTFVTPQFLDFPLIKENPTQLNVPDISQTNTNHVSDVLQLLELPDTGFSELRTMLTM